MNKFFFNKITNAVLGLMFCLLLCSCASKIVSGNYVRSEDLLNLQNSKLSRSQILELIGPPSFTFNSDKNEKWFYVGRTYKKRAFFKPGVTDQYMLQIIFDSLGNYDTKITKNEHIEIDLEESSVQTIRPAENLFKQFIGNLGKYNKKQKDKNVR